MRVTIGWRALRHNNEMVLIKWELIGDECMKKETKNCCVKLVKSMLSAGNGRIRKYKKQFQYCRIQQIIIQYKNSKHTAHFMLQPSPQVFQSNCSHHRSSHLPWMMFWFQSNNSRRRCWRCVWQLDEERCVTTMRWCWSSENWSKTNEWKKKQKIVVSN